MPVPANPFADLTRTLSGFKWPTMDLNAFTEMQRRNFEAMTRANQVAVDGFRALIERQAEIAQTSAAEAQSAIRNLAEGGKGPDFEAQLTTARAAMEKATADLRELQEIVARSQTEVFDILNSRMIEAVDEMRQPAVKD